MQTYFESSSSVHQLSPGLKTLVRGSGADTKIKGGQDQGKLHLGSQLCLQ